MSIIILSACAKTDRDTGETDTTKITPPPPAVSAPTAEDVKNLPASVSAMLKTSMGDIKVTLLPQKSPLAVANFLNLARAGFYNGVKFHRVIPDFMIQTGDPNSKDDNWADDGMGGPGYQFADEVASDDSMVRGTLAMANAGPNTNGSQFFIVTSPDASWLNGRHTIFGTVETGQEVAEKISQVARNNDDHPLQDVVITEIIIE